MRKKKPETNQDAIKSCGTCRNLQAGNICRIQNVPVTVKTREICYLSGGWYDPAPAQILEPGELPTFKGTGKKRIRRRGSE